MPKIAFEVDAQTDKRLEQLRQKLGAANKAEVVSQAIALLDFAVQNKRDDGTVVISGTSADGMPAERTLLVKEQ